MTNFVMLTNVMLSNLIKARRLEKNLSTLEVSIRTRLDPSLISRYENGNRIPTRDHAIRLAIALDMNEEGLLSAWLIEKLKKVLSEEERESVRENALNAIIDKTGERKLVLIQGSRITDSQEAALNKWKPEIQQLRERYPEKWEEIKKRNLILLCFQFSTLVSANWNLSDLTAFIREGKTNPHHDFQAHLSLNNLYTLLKKIADHDGHISEEHVYTWLNQLAPLGAQHVAIKVESNLLVSLAQAWVNLAKQNALSPGHRYLALLIYLKGQGFPLFSLPENSLGLDEVPEILPLGEFFGEWLIKEMRRWKEALTDH